MAAELRGRRIAILAAEGVEQVELEEPRKAVQEAGAVTAGWHAPCWESRYRGYFISFSARLSEDPFDWVTAAASTS